MNYCKKVICSVFLSCVLFAFPFSLRAQIDIKIGTGTTGNASNTYPCPLQDYAEGSKAQYLFKASELTAGGMAKGYINAISFNVLALATGARNAVEHYTIKIGTTTTTALATNSWIAGTTVMYGPVDYTPVPGKNTFTFPAPFLWDGTSNLVVEVCNGDPDNANDDYYSENASVEYTTNVGFNANHTLTRDDAGPLCDITTGTLTGTNRTYRPNITFNWTSSTPCAGIPVAGTAIAALSTVCSGNTVAIQLNGAESTAGLSYQWQSSADGSTNWQNITGATGKSYGGIQSTATYYRAALTCSAGGGVGYSTAVQVNTPAFLSGNFTIDNTKPAGGNNFTTFNDAYNAIKCGINGAVVFDVAAGTTYNEQLIMQAVNGASATNTITFNGHGSTISYASANTNDRAVIKLNGASHLIFNNLTITAPATATYGFGVQLMNNADSNTVNNCIISVSATATNNGFAGIVVNGAANAAVSTVDAYCDGNTFSGNTITGGYYGIVNTGSTNVANSGNTFINNTVQEFYQYGIYLGGNSKTLVQGNTIKRATRATGSVSVYGIYMTSLNTLNSINGNKVTALTGTGTNSTNIYGIAMYNITSFGGLENVVSNNLVYDLGASTNVTGLYDYAADNTYFFFNTVSLGGNGAASAASNTVRGFYINNDPASVVFNKNIVTISRTGPGEKTCIYFSDNFAQVSCDSNDLYIFPGIGGVTNVGYDGVNFQTALAAWQTGATQDQHSFSANPLYKNTTTADYTPQEATIDDKGAIVSGIDKDILGTVRSTTTPDIGAYEFTVPACVTPPTPGTATVSKDTVCGNTLVTLSLKDYTIGKTQTYQWQSAATAGGTYTDMGTPLNSPDTSVRTATTIFYRVKVICSGQSAFSVPVQLTIRQPLAGGIYTINQNAAPGSADYKSFNDAKLAMACGIDDKVAFNVTPASGPYAEQLQLDSLPGTTAAKTVTFNGNGNTIRYSSSKSGQPAVITLNGADHVILDSLMVDATGAGSYSYGVQLWNHADSNVIRKCTINASTTITNYNAAALVINSPLSPANLNDASNPSTQCNGNLFDNNVIKGGYYGVTALGGYDVPLYNNRFSNNQVLDFLSDGFFVSYTYASVLEHNTISRPTRNTGIDFGGITIAGNANNATIIRNIITNPSGGKTNNAAGAQAITFSTATVAAATPALVADNLVYNMNLNGELFTIYNNSTDNVKYYHNTISLDNTTSNADGRAFGFYVLGDVTGVEWKNNITTITRGGTGGNWGIYISQPGGIDLRSNANDFYINGASGNNSVGHVDNDFATLPLWRNSIGQDTASVSIDPRYKNAATGDFTPTVSPLDNTGLPLGIPIDILDSARSILAPDMGAFEFNLPPCTAPPTAGTSVATPASGICMGTTIDLTVSGNSEGSGQIYQWQQSVNGTDNWTNLGDPKFAAASNTAAMHSMYYRVGITCGTNTAFATPAHVVLNGGLAAGIYTIDPSGSGNFTSFTAAVAAMDCGIEGPVTFNVKAGTYTESVRMHKVAGASDTSRITFQAANGDATSVLLTNTGGTGDADNYVLALDSASYVTYKNISISSTGSYYATAVKFVHNASYDSLLHCILTSQVPPYGLSEPGAVVDAKSTSGIGNMIRGNTILNGTYGIYQAGSSYNRLIPAIAIDSNTIRGAYQGGVYSFAIDHMLATNNTITIADPIDYQNVGIQLNAGNSAYTITGNTVAINNTSATAYGIWVDASNTDVQHRSLIAHNSIRAVTGNTADVAGLRITNSVNTDVVNNVVSVNTTGANSYGIYTTAIGTSSGGFSGVYYNNSVLNASASSADNYAGYFSVGNASVGQDYLRNNIFTHKGGGVAVFYNDPAFMNSDYNMLYTTGGALVVSDVISYASLPLWIAASQADANSIVYKPAFLNDTTLRPDIRDSAAWVMNGRGVQFTGNDHDFDNNARPATLQAGVPDLGAYEFTPISVPVVAAAIPATPVANSRQVFMLGTDTVNTITWGANVPQLVKMRRYSGAVPPGLVAGKPYMYFYTEAETQGTGAYNFGMQQNYLDPWRGFIEQEPSIRLGRYEVNNTWVADTAGGVNIDANVITHNNLSYLGRFTGLIDSVTAMLADANVQTDSSNSGTRFWVGYGNNQLFSSDNSENMVLYLSAREATTVTVKINGTAWVKTYFIPANTVIASDTIPNSGIFDARLMAEGKYTQGISIESDKPIVAYAHIYAYSSSGATMLLPAGSYGYEYYALTARQRYQGISPAYSWFYVVADHDNTQVEITPSCLTTGGHPAGVPFTVSLNKGEIYQVLGAAINRADGYDITGSRIRAVKNADGRCYPIAVFSGSGRTSIDCNPTSSVVLDGDNIIQQNFPLQAWGKRYLTAPTSSPDDARVLSGNVYRVLVKDPLTVVKRNGVVLTDLVNNSYYQYTSNTADYIEATDPVMVAQFMSSNRSACDNTNNADGDPEMFYLSPIEQGIKRTDFYRNVEKDIDMNYLTLIIPTTGIPSLKLDNSNVFDYTYAHPNLPGYSVVVKRWNASQGQSTLSSDSAFTAITYGMGFAESYGYNAGTLVRNLNSLPGFANVYDSSGANSDHTCVGTPFRFNMLLPIVPSSITWKFSLLGNLRPYVDSVQQNPVPVDSTVINGRKLYRFTVNQEYMFSQPGTYYVPVLFTSPDIESCDNSQQVFISVKVIDGFKDDFTIDYTGCQNDTAHFSGLAGPASNGATINRWRWDFGDNTTAATQDTVKLFGAGGTFHVKLRAIAQDACVADTTKDVVVKPNPAFAITDDSLQICRGADAAFAIKTPDAGAVYNWYDGAAGGSPVHTGSNYTVSGLSADADWYVSAVQGGCTSPRMEVVAEILPALSAPVVTADSIGGAAIRFSWNAVANAVGYQVSLDGGNTWIAPSSGTTGLSHTVAGLRPGQQISILVKAAGVSSCQEAAPAQATAITSQGKVFAPNAFTPNGDGTNDKFVIIGEGIKELHLVIFNQWGAKIFDLTTTSATDGWDGNFNGQPQPSGVYMFVCKAIMTDGSTQTKKGSINLIR